MGNLSLKGASLKWEHLHVYQAVAKYVYQHTEQVFIRSRQVCARAISALLSHRAGWNVSLSLPVISTRLQIQMQIHHHYKYKTYRNTNTHCQWAMFDRIWSADRHLMVISLQCQEGCSTRPPSNADGFLISVIFSSAPSRRSLGRIINTLLV